MNFSVILSVILLMLMGGVGLAAAFYIPHKEHFTSDHSVGAGFTGIAWAGSCLALALLILLHSIKP